MTAWVLHVPGHTPEHLALAVMDRTRAPEPWFLFTGHTLMVGDMGRTELASSLEEPVHCSGAPSDCGCCPTTWSPRRVRGLGLGRRLQRQAWQYDRL